MKAAAKPTRRPGAERPAPAARAALKRGGLGITIPASAEQRAAYEDYMGAGGWALLMTKAGEDGPKLAVVTGVKPKRRNKKQR